jgi:hypothetical protein
MDFTASGQVLYNINFNNQPANSLVQTGAPPQFISSINFGTPTVVSSFGGLHDQPLRLGLGGTYPFFYDQVQLNFSNPLGSALDFYFDFTSVGLVGSQASGLFRAIGIGVESVDFDSSGVISAFNGHTVPLGHFTDNETFRMWLHIDVPNQTCTVYKDGVMLGPGAFPSHIASDGGLRFSYGVNSFGPRDSSAVAIDNVLLVAVPEPSTLSLAALAGLAVLTLKRRRLQSKPIHDLAHPSPCDTINPTMT